MPKARNPESRRRKFPYFIGFYTTKAQRDKLDRIMQQTNRGLGDTMRLVVDNLKCRVVELDLTALEVNASDAPEA